MGSTSTRLIKHLTYSFTLLSAAFLSACSGTPETPVEEDEVKSVNVFFSEENHTGASVGKVYQFTPGGNGRILELSDVNVGNDSIAVLDTDEEAPGYEYAAFIDGRTIKLIDYAKTAPQRLYELREYSADICGVYPVKRPSESAYDRESDYYLKEINDTAIHVALKNGAECSNRTDNYVYLSFSTNGEHEINDSRFVDYGDVFGSFFFDPLYTAPGAAFDAEKGRAIWISYNREASRITGVASNGDSLFSAPLGNNTTPSVAIVNRLDSGRVFIQEPLQTTGSGQPNLAIHLFDLTTLGELLDSIDSGATQNPFEVYFQSSDAQLEVVTPNVPVTFSHNANAIVFEDISGLKYTQYRDSRVEQKYTSRVGVTIDFTLSANGEIVLQQNQLTESSLSIINENNNAPDTILIGSAQEINFSQTDDALYVNALNPSNVLNRTTGLQGWNAIKISQGRLEQLLENALVLALPNPLNDEFELILLSSSQMTNNETLVSPLVTQYDSEEIDGIRREREFSSDEELEITDIKTGIFGQIQEDLTSIDTRFYGSNAIANKDYALFSAFTTEGLNSYFVRPSQDLVGSDEDRKLTLAKLTSNPAIQVLRTNLKTLSP